MDSGAKEGKEAVREPKPLTKDEREKIARLWAHGDSMFHSSIRDLLADAQFWREAVKRIAPWDKNGFCMLCDSVATWDTEKHKPGCPWRLAQD